MTKKYFFYTILSLAVIACAAIGWYQNQKRETADAPCGNRDKNKSQP